MLPPFFKPLLFSLLLINTAMPVAHTPHPLHVATADISYNAKEGQLEVICNMFTEDLQDALATQFKGKIDLEKADMHKTMDVLVKKYLTGNVTLKTDGTPAPLNYLGYEINHEAVNVYLESGKIKQPKKMEADDSLMYNLYTDQINIVHMTVAGVRKSGKLDYPDRLVDQVF